MVPFLRTLTFFLLFWTHQVLIIPLLIFRSWQSRSSTEPAQWARAYKQGHFWGKLTCRLGGAQVTVQDRSDLDPDQAVLLVSNHQGDFDIPMLLAYSGRQIAFVAKKELAHLPLISRWMRLLGCIFLDREDRRKQVKQVRQIVSQLERGLSMVIFPEGTRSQGGAMRPFAAGSLNIAEKAGVPILPVTLVDTHKLFPKGGLLLPGAKVSVILHPTIDPSTLSKEEKKSLHTRVQDIVQSGLDEDE